MRGYSSWLDAKVDPARGISGLRLLWNQHWIVVLHTAAAVAFWLTIDWLFAVETQSALYYFIGTAVILTPFVTLGYLWVRRAKLWSRKGNIEGQSHG